MSPRRFSTSDRHSGEPQNKQYGGHDPQEVSGEPDPEENQNYQKS
jgi:hypothetical protein